MSAKNNTLIKKLAVGIPALIVLLGLGGFFAFKTFYPQPPAPEGAHAKNNSHDHGGHDDHGSHAEHGEEVRLTSEAIKQSGIRVEPVSEHALTSSFTAPARVSFNAERVAHVGSSVQGRVRELKVRVGEQVKQGDVLMVIDSPELGEAQSQYLQKRTAVDVATPAVELAKSAYNRAKNLYDETQGIALTEVQKREAEYKAAQGAVLTAQAELTAAENRLHLLGMSQEAVISLGQTGEIDSLYNVRAPISGQMIEREVTLGELVGPDREALLVLADMSTLWVIVDVPEAKLSQVAVGSKARISVPAIPGQAFEGAVSYISTNLAPATRTASVRIELNNSDTGLRPGMFAQAEVVSGARPGAASVLAVPESAIQVVEGEPSVFVAVKGEPNTFAKRPVKIGPTVGGLVQVFHGLKQGESVVVSGSFILKAELGKAGAAHEH